MALTLATIRNGIITSLHGRRLGFDVNDVLVGSKAIKRPITDATSDTTGTDLPNTGIVSVVTTTNDTWALTAPLAGVEVTIMTGSDSTGEHTIAGSTAAGTAATFQSAESSTGPGIVLQGGNASMTLVGVSTALWRATSRIGTTRAHVSTA